MDGTHQCAVRMIPVSFLSGLDTWCVQSDLRLDRQSELLPLSFQTIQHSSNSPEVTLHGLI